MPFLATMPTTMIMPMIDEMFSAVPVSQSAARLPDSARLLPSRIATAAASEPNSIRRSALTHASEPANTSMSSANACC